MGVFSRLTDIVNANMNALLDKAEDPEKMIRMVIQEMEETLVEVRSNSAKILADKKEIQRRNEFLNRQAAEWHRKAEFALGKDREDLARAALVERSAILDAIGTADEDLVRLDKSLDKLDSEIEQLQSKLDDARSRQKTILMRQQATDSRLVVNQKLHDGSVDRAIDRFEHFEKKINRVESEIESFQMGQGDIRSEINALAKDEEIDQELADLKSALTSKTEDK